jgi:glucan 1,3-beta-glucosidase
VGANWAQFVASGSAYSNMNSPQVMIKVGNAGDVGNIEIQDVLFTVKGATQGAVLLEWNAKAATQGSVAMWGMHTSPSFWDQPLTCQYRFAFPNWWCTRN